MHRFTRDELAAALKQMEDDEKALADQMRAAALFLQQALTNMGVLLEHNYGSVSFRERATNGGLYPTTRRPDLPQYDFVLSFWTLNHPFVLDQPTVVKNKVSGNLTGYFEMIGPDNTPVRLYLCQDQDIGGY